MTDYEKAFDFLCRWEGWYSNDPDDSGGETILGITKTHFPNEFEAIKALPDDQKVSYARDFYEVNFWKQFNCEAYVYPLNMVLFDCSVNTGKIFYEDGDNWVDVLFKRMKYYSDIVKRNPSQVKFLRGWFNRCIGLYEEVSNAL